MTREEAINLLVNATYSDEWQGNEDLTMALDMTIKALEQETCEDCISRAELLKAIDTWDKFGLDDINHLFRLDNLSLPYYVPYIHYDDVIKCIKGMPSVQPKADVLDKIRAEIAEEKIGHDLDVGNEILYNKAIDDCLQIIDKYRQEG